MKRNNHKIFSFFTIILCFLLGTVPSFAENIDPDNDGSQYAWSENHGWINLEPDNTPGVDVSASQLTGYMWGENVGWINMAPQNGGVINDGLGILSGYAWGENTGWINFAPNNGGVTVDPLTGIFSGLAWGENIGWINFAPNGSQIKTSWTFDNNNNYTSQFDLSFTSCASGPLETVNITRSSGAIATLNATGAIEGTLTTTWANRVNINSGTYSGWAYARANYSLQTDSDATYTGSFYVIYNNNTGQAWGRTTGDLVAATRKIGDSRRWFITSINGIQTSGTINLELIAGTPPPSSSTFDTDAKIFSNVSFVGTSTGVYDGPWLNDALGIGIPALKPDNGFALPTYTTPAGSGKGWMYFYDTPETARRFGSWDGTFFGTAFRTWKFEPSCLDQVVKHIHEHVLNSGVDETTEDNAPNNGDANNDGTPDSDQNNVASLENVETGTFVAVDTTSSGTGADITNVSTYTETSLANDPDFDLPHGLVKFDVIGLTPGSVETIRIYFHDIPDLTTGYVYRKYDQHTATWSTLPNDCTGSPNNCVTFGSENIAGKNVAYADLRITDGGPFDANKLVDGVIEDPGGPALPDNDNDGMGDQWELDNGLDPTNSADANWDNDSDGLINVDEFNYSTDPLDNDTDSDGLLDGDEVSVHGTDPTSVDTDGDGTNDGAEVAGGSDPLVDETPPTTTKVPVHHGLWLILSMLLGLYLLRRRKTVTA